jgi:hypothetical protein
MLAMIDSSSRRDMTLGFFAFHADHNRGSIGVATFSWVWQARQ